MSDEKPKVQRAETHIEHVIYAERVLDGETNLSGGACRDLVEIAKIHVRSDAEKLAAFLREMGFKVSMTRTTGTVISRDKFDEEEDPA